MNRQNQIPCAIAGDFVYYIYSGEEREFKLNEIASSYGAITVSMDDTLPEEAVCSCEGDMVKVHWGNLMAAATKRPAKRAIWSYKSKA